MHEQTNQQRIQSSSSITSMTIPLLLLVAISLLTFPSSSSSSFSSSTNLRLDLTHVDAASDFTKLELIQRAASRSKHRSAKLSSKKSTRVPVHPSEAEYLINLAIGTPPRNFSAILDTGSDLIWTQCTPCQQCFPQPTPLFDPTLSSTYSLLPCNTTLCNALPPSACKLDSCIYEYGYGDGSSSAGTLAFETFTLGSNTTAHLGFGCGILNQGNFANASGLVGFGRGPLSLISQLNLAEFSYCFTSFGDFKTSTLILGSHTTTTTTTTTTHHHHHHSRATTTPLVRNPFRPTFYYLSLRGITVGATRLPIPEKAFALRENGTGGVIIDSGTTITQLEGSAYNEVRTEFLRQVKLPIGNASSEGLDLCFTLPETNGAKVEVPKLVFHFEGADLELTRENYVIEDSGLLCLTIMGTDSGGMSIFGNLQQQNMHIRYNLKKETVSFLSTRCDRS